MSASQSRLVYDFSTNNTDRTRQETKGASSSPSRVPKMATMVVTKPAIVAKKPSIKKYKAPTPPIVCKDEICDIAKDKENNVLQKEDNANEADSCKQTREQEEDAKEQVIGKSSPVVRRMVPKLNGNADRSSVLSKAAMFEAGSPKAKDPAEMSLRERKALFEKNKGAAIVPKAPFGQAPSVKTLLGDKESKPVRLLTHTTPTKSSSSSSSKTNSKENIDDNVSQTSIGGGIKDKLAALFSKERTISEATISSKFKLEREKEMEMLQSRFHTSKDIKANTMDSDNEDDHSEKAPLMGGGSALSLNQINKKPEIIANIPKVTFDESKCRSETALHDREAEDEVDRVVGSQPVKRRSSQDSPQVLAVLDDVKRIRVNTDKKNGNGSLPQPSIYPHLSDIETDASQSPDENSDCGSSTEANDKMNKSDNWAETSFGREVMKVVKKNNSSYNKAIKDKDYCDSSNSIDSELEDVLDEALNDDDSEGPTPPKLHKNRNSLSSKSFTFKEGSPAKKEFKSPLKVNNAPARNNDRGNELVHSVSFYRRMQNASSQPTTPIRVIRHTSPDREVSSTPEQATSVTTVRERIKQLQNEIFKQQNIISQASQALNLCAATIEFSGSTEQAEGERLLLLATHRRQACLHEVQRLQVEGAGEAGRAGCASLQLGGIRLPLKRDYMRKLNADGAVGHHAVCLLKCRDRVLATSMQLTQPTGNVLHFPDHINMDGLTSDFKVTVEVYLLQASKEMLPHDVKYHISNKKSSSKLLTPKSKAKSELKAPKIQSPAGPLSVRSPQFQAHGYCIFALPQADRKTFTLNKVPCGSPLEGSAHIEIAARVKVPAPAPHNAFLTAFDDVSGLGAWHRRWFVLQPPRLTYWKYPDDVQKKMPIGDIDLQSVISETATRAPRDLCARPNTILLESSVPPGLIVPDSGSLVYVKRGDGTVVRRHLLAADTPADRDVWIEALNTALEFVRCSSTDDD